MYAVGTTARDDQGRVSRSRCGFIAVSGQWGLVRVLVFLSLCQYKDGDGTVNIVKCCTAWWVAGEMARDIPDRGIGMSVQLIGLRATRLFVIFRLWLRRHARNSQQ